MVINKPAGMVVHPGAGTFHGNALINAVAWHMRNVPSFDANNPEVGLVHRIDKDTSGLLVVAKTPEAKTLLGKQPFTRQPTVATSHSSGPTCGGRRAHRGKYRPRRARPSAHGRLPSRLGDGQASRDPLARTRTLRLHDARGVYPRDRTHTPDPRTHAATSAIHSSATHAMAARRSCADSVAAPTRRSYRTAFASARDKPSTHAHWASSTPRRDSRWISRRPCQPTWSNCSQNGGATSMARRRTPSSSNKYELQDKV